MKRTVALLLALGLAATAWAFNVSYTSGLNGISVTATNTNLAFTDNHSGGSASAFKARWITIRSRSGSDTCCYDTDALATCDDATTSDHRLAASETAQLTFRSSQADDGWSNLAMICDTGESATWDVDAGR